MTIREAAELLNRRLKGHGLLLAAWDWDRVAIEFAGVMREMLEEEREACVKVAEREWACTCSGLHSPCSGCIGNLVAGGIVKAIRARATSAGRPASS